MLKNIVILGSNNVLGIKAIDFFKRYSNKYKIYGISFDGSIDNLPYFIEQIKEIQPKAIFFENSSFEEDILKYGVFDCSVFLGNNHFINFIHPHLLIYRLLNYISSIKTTCP